MLKLRSWYIWVTICFACTWGSAVAQTHIVQQGVPDTIDLMNVPFSKERPYEAELALKEWIPAGYILLDTASGRLNNDHYSDIAIVVMPKNSKVGTEIKVRKTLILLLGQSNGSYKSALRNSEVLNDRFRIEVGTNDTYRGIQIQNGSIWIRNGISKNGKHWMRMLVFSYDPRKKDWLLQRKRFVAYNMNHESGNEGEAMINAVDEVSTKDDFGEVSLSKFKG